MTTKIKKWGNDLAIRLPKAVTQKLALKEGGNIIVYEERNRIVIQTTSPRKKEFAKDMWKHFLIPTKKRKKT